jgi:hypothetical protein
VEDLGRRRGVTAAWKGEGSPSSCTSPEGVSSCGRVVEARAFLLHRLARGAVEASNRGGGAVEASNHGGCVRAEEEGENLRRGRAGGQERGFAGGDRGGCRR